MYIKPHKLQLVLIICLIQLQTVILWPNHDISTLKLLQIVHRHGDRTIENYFKNDPFLNKTVKDYWPEGFGELTTLGKYRMYKFGQFIRNEYQEYLGDNYSPREIYARSSPVGRCLESVLQILSGAYPPNNTQWQWKNGTDAELGANWQPFPIYSFDLAKKDEDRLLRVEAYCPNAAKEQEEIYNSDLVVGAFEKEKEFLSHLSDIVGQPINTPQIANDFWDTITIEKSRGYNWYKFDDRWSPEYYDEVLTKIIPLAKLIWDERWNNTLIQRTRAGDLINELVENMRLKTEGMSRTAYDHKLFLYSTHDTKLAVLMHALKLWNYLFIPFGSSLLFELHQNSTNDQYFVRIYYNNETLAEDKWPHLLTIPDCDNAQSCPLDQFYRLTAKLIPENFEVECGISNYSCSNPLSLLLFITCAFVVKFIIF